MSDTLTRQFRRGDHVLIDGTPGRIWAVDGPRPETDHGTAYIYFDALNDDGRDGTAVIVTPDLTASMYKHRTLALVRPDDSPVVAPTDPSTGAVTAPTPSPVGDTTDADWDALAAMEGPDCPACEDDPDEPHVDGCRWIARQRANRPITLTLNDARMMRHASDPDLTDLYDAGWTEVPLEQVPSLVRLDYAEAAALFGATADALLTLTADASPAALREAFAAARKALDEFEAVTS